MTLGELRDAYTKVRKIVDDIYQLGDPTTQFIDVDITIGLDNEWCYLVSNQKITLEYYIEDNFYRSIVYQDDVRQAMTDTVNLYEKEIKQ